MKTIKNNVLVMGASLLSLAGCANIQNHPLYSAWQEQAYGVYGMQPNVMVSPAYQQQPSGALVYMPQQGYVSPPAITVSAPVSRDEQRYIATYYGL